MTLRLVGWVLTAGSLIAVGASVEATEVGRAQFHDPRNPPPWRILDSSEQQAYDLGQAVFNTAFVPAGTKGAGRVAGVGPFFGNASCDGCHNNGARGRGPVAAGRAPAQLVMQLGRVASDEGDPIYGKVLSPSVAGAGPPEGHVTIAFVTRIVRFPDGSSHELREPHYRPANLAYGALAADTVIRPRMANALFGAGLLDAVPVSALEALEDPEDRDRDGIVGRIAWTNSDGRRQAGRFGWQAGVSSLRAQTARAFVLEQGLTSADEPVDDCTPWESACGERRRDSSREVSAELMDAVVAFQSLLAVPAADRGAVPANGGRIFESIGCARCHRPELPVALAGGTDRRIRAYTDLLLHDLGSGLADRTESDRPVPSRWRTAPLWGLAIAVADPDRVALLHDGRARNIGEAILWHDGEAQSARIAYMGLAASDRQALLNWIATL